MCVAEGANVGSPTEELEAVQPDEGIGPRSG
jgi:hypothetical protein